MPIFDLETGRPTVLQPMQPAAGTFDTDARALVTQHLVSLLGEPLFPVAAGAPGSDQPHLLAVDAAGQPVVVEVVQVLDGTALTRSLQHAGSAARMSSVDLARAYRSGPESFATDLVAFRETVPVARVHAAARHGGARLFVLCSEVAENVVDGVEFLRGPGRRLEVLQLGVLRGADGRRYAEVSPLAPSLPTRRPVEPSSLRAVLPTGALPVLADDGVTGAGAAPDRESVVGALAPHGTFPSVLPVPVGPVPAASGDIPERAGADGRAPLVGQGAADGGAQPTDVDGAEPTPDEGAGATEDAGVEDVTGPGDGPAEDGAGDDAAADDGAAEGEAGDDRADDDGVGGDAAAEGEATDDRAAADDRAGDAGAAADDAIAAAAGVPVDDPDTDPESPAAAEVVEDDDVSDATAPVPVVPVPGEDDAAPDREAGAPEAEPAPHPGLAGLAEQRGGATTLVWTRLRRGQRFVAVLRPDGLIELPDGSLHADPGEAATLLADAEAPVDGWRTWRVGDDGPTLADACAGSGPTGGR